MDVSETPQIPSSMTFPKAGERIPVGSLRIDQSDDNWVMYSKIAADNNLKDTVKNPLWFNFLDNEYGIQNNYQHQYDEVRPYMRSEPFKYYAGSQNEYVEFMLRFFAWESAKDDVHRNYEFLTMLQLPWIDINGSGYKYPPPRLVLSINLSVIRVGYITAMNVTWYSPVGYEGTLVYNLQNKAPRTFNPLVYYYCECLMTFTVVGTRYGGNSFRDIPTGNQRMNNLSIGRSEK